MTAIKLLLYILFVSMCTSLYAQVQFAQVNQLPTLLSPSMAGSKEQKRIIIGVNNYTSNNETAGSNIAIGYDQMIKKIGCGIGVYYLQNNFKENLINENDLIKFPENTRKTKYYTIENQKTTGICIAPKYNITFKDNPYKIKYTFSPSIFIELGKSTNTMLCNPSFEYKYTNTPVYYNWTEENYYKYSYNNTFFRSGLGVQLNNKKLIVLGKIAFTRNSYSEQISYTTFLISTNTESETQPKTANSTFYAVEPTLHLGYTFSKETNTSFAFTPILGIGIIHYFNLDAQSIQSDSDKSRYNITQNELSEINYVHASANARYKKLLFGAAYSYYQTSIYKGITLGFQNNRMKVMYTMGFNFYKTLSTFHQVEVTSGFFF